MEFEWDPVKAAQNFRKHKVSFNEAATVFSDFLGATVADPDHSVDEHRYITVQWADHLGVGCLWSLMRSAANGFGSSVLED